MNRRVSTFVLFVLLSPTSALMADDPFQGCQAFTDVQHCPDATTFPGCAAPDPDCSTVYRKTGNQYLLPVPALNGQAGVWNPSQNDDKGVVCEESRECIYIEVSGVPLCYPDSKIEDFD